MTSPAQERTDPDVTSRTAEAKGRARASVHDWTERLVGLSHRLHAHPELAFDEHESSRQVADLLEEAGLAVERGVCDLPTALFATAGDGELTVGICAEYDALPGIGHACGHNVIASAAVGAAIALAPLADELGIRVKLLGTPAEEHGGGKVLMLERGAFDDVTVAMMVHPAPVEVHAEDFRTQAVSGFRVTYTGTASHAAAAPERGVNAADAAVVAQVALGLLRQQFPFGTRAASFVSKGGQATNVIPAEVTVEAEVRALTVEAMYELKQRVLRCFEAGALATGCAWTTEDTQPVYAEMRPDPWLAAAFHRNITALGRVVNRFGAQGGGGSTDMGNVTHVVPGIQPGITFAGAVSPPHTVGFAAEAVTAGADEAIVDAAVAMAWTAIDLATDARQREAALAAHGDRRRDGATTDARAAHR